MHDLDAAPDDAYASRDRLFRDLAVIAADRGPVDTRGGGIAEAAVGAGRGGRP